MHWKTWPAAMTSRQPRCADGECVSDADKAYEFLCAARDRSDGLNFRTGEFVMSTRKLSKQVVVVLLCCSLAGFTAQADAYSSIAQSNDPTQSSPAQHSPQELQQLVAPIALYPDALVAQILAASTYPTEIVEADRWVQSHAQLQGEDQDAKIGASAGHAGHGAHFVAGEQVGGHGDHGDRQGLVGKAGQADQRHRHQVLPGQAGRHHLRHDLDRQRARLRARLMERRPAA